MEIRVIFSLAFKDMNDHEWIINKLFMTFHDLFVVIRVQYFLGDSGLRIRGLV